MDAINKCLRYKYDEFCENATYSSFLKEQIKKIQAVQINVSKFDRSWYLIQNWNPI